MKTKYYVVISSMLIILLGLISPIDAYGQKKKIKHLPTVSDPGGNCDNSEYKLVFQDEFEGNGLDRTKWITYFSFSDDGSENCEACRYLGSNNSVFMDDQVSVNDGILKLAVEQKETTWYSKTTEHRGSAIRSLGPQFTFGKYEIRCRLPNGRGLWPAFWMFGGETEIDVFEICGERPKWIKASLHQWGDQRYSNTGKYKGIDHSAEFHTYTVEWERDELRWYIDGEMIYVRGRYVDRRGRPLPGCDRPAGSNRIAPYFPRPQDKVNVIADNSVDKPKGYCNGPKKAEPWPAESAMLVDYIRVYQQVPNDGLSNLCSTPKNLILSPSNSVLKHSEQRNVELTGAHGSLLWECSEGLRITARTHNGVTVKAVGKAGKQWIRVISTNDPCSPETVTLEVPIEIEL